MVESLDLMEDVVEGPLLSTDAFFVGYLEDLVPELTALDSTAVIIHNVFPLRKSSLNFSRTVLDALRQVF